jgi:hypothetical protein
MRRRGNPWAELDKLGASWDGIRRNDDEAAWDRVDMLREVERFHSRRWRR